MIWLHVHCYGFIKPTLASLVNELALKIWRRKCLFQTKKGQIIFDVIKRMKNSCEVKFVCNFYLNKNFLKYIYKFGSTLNFVYFY